MHTYIGCVKVWDIRQKDPVVEISPSEGEHKRDCWTVAFGNSFNDESRSVCAGYDNGDLKMFDLRTLSLQWETHLPNGVCSLLACYCRCHVSSVSYVCV